ncbi:hypothetical protein CCMSSC00406_0009641 [Pleurotus cornucopiae]|uniref:Uncharacterized protein n=1 Tax=Pleurotus cornucopiae TaxID=5321 RepID=A0ACB7JBD7_PLECO|nr:hypothetical protein CCMSSC00406_0009641 [Pleurotus cornucopiae]
MASTQGVRDSVRLDLQPFYSGSIRVVSDTHGPARRATIELYEAGSSEPIETTTFVKKMPVRTGELVLETDDDKAVWFYAAQAQGAYIKVSIEGDHSGKFEYLNTMKPITILADDVPGKGTEHYNFDDGVVTVLQYK